MRIPIRKYSSITKLKIITSANVSRLMSSVLLKESIISTPTTYQHLIFKYLNDTNYCEQIVERLIIQKDFKIIRKEIQKYTESSYSLKPNNFDERLVSDLPSYIFNLKNKSVHEEIIISCDKICYDQLNFTFDKHSNLSSLDLIHSWLYLFYPNINRIQETECYGKLIKTRCREIFTNPTKELEPSHIALVYLVFVAGMGKKNSFDNHEVLNQIAIFSQANPEITYERCNTFELAAICDGFFKGGIKLESERFLSHISSTLCFLLSPYIHGSSSPTIKQNEFNPYVVISLLKIIRQVNYVEGKVLRLLSEFIIKPENEKKVHNIGFLSNIVSAFVGPGRKSLGNKNDAKVKSESTVLNVLKRVEHLVVEIIREKEKFESDKIERKRPRNTPVTKDLDSLSRIRLKDISRWLWAASSLGYQISPEAYEQDLNRRFSSGEFTRRPDDAIDALLALAIMNHYLDIIVMKVLHCPDFRSALRARCSQRYKGRFGLFLTALKVERNDLWKQLSKVDISQLMDVVGAPISETKGWKSYNFPVKVRQDQKALMSMPEMKNHKTHSELLNKCMDSLKRIFDVSEEEDNNNNYINGNRGHKNTNGALKSRLDYKIMGDSKTTSTTIVTKLDSGLKESSCNQSHRRSNLNLVAQIVRGHAVPYLHIPGIKVILLNSGKEIYVEVLHEDAISPGLHQFKLRLLEKIGYSVFTITYEQIKNDLNLEEYLRTKIKK